jgi:serine/threonine protein kinase/tetratricopeptide (TPR) repeat protein
MTEREIFVAALHKTDAERAAYLDEACAGDAALRQRIETLLAEQDRLGSFMDVPSSSATIDRPPERPGTQIGPYKLIEQIGEGGMGTVWMAQQAEPVKRVVAVKLIKAGMDSAQVIARFEAERQALALMDHANIARVLDAGTTEAGRPYFVMDLVRGVPITRYCDEHHLTPRQRLELFIPVCQAIQHAHQKGIIHRDLKPSNVLVALYDGKPVPKVIDFGVAKATGQSLTDKTLVTGFGNIVGTLEYMSPEQAETNQLDIDTRSDIYSLGVLLYELLTGSPPFSRKELERAGMLEMLRVIREDEPSKPSTKLSTAEGLPTLAANRGTEPAKLTNLVRGELDWIVMKALEKDRSRRYETANSFAADVQRYLADEPVQACPPSAGYRLRKFVRRNKGGLAVALLMLFFLVILGSGIGWAVRDRSAREAKIAQERATREAELKREQEARRAKVAGQVESILGEVDRLEQQENWHAALAAARRAAAALAGGEADPKTTERVRQRLKDLAFIDRLERIRMQKATWVEGNFDYTGANREYAQAFREYGVDIVALPARTSIDRLKARPALVTALAATLDDWFFSQISEKDVGDRKLLVAVARGIDPEPLRDRMRSSWGQPRAEAQDELRRLADSIDARTLHPATVLSLARSLQQLNLSDSALRILRDAQSANPGDFWLNFHLALALYEQKDHEGAIRFYTAAVAIRPKSSAALTNLGISLAVKKRLDEAIACYKIAIEIDPTNANAHTGLGSALCQQEKPDEAIDAYRKAIEIDPKFAYAHTGLGYALHTQYKLDEAIAAYGKAVELDPNNAYARNKLALCLNDLAWSLATHAEPARRDPARAVSLAKEAVELKPQEGSYWNTLGAAHYRAGDWKAAIAALEKSMELRKGDDSNDWFFLAMAQWQLGERDKARQWYDRAVEWMDKNQPKNEDLRRFRAEAEELMKKEKQQARSVCRS